MTSPTYNQLIEKTKKEIEKKRQEIKRCRKICNSNEEGMGSREQEDYIKNKEATLSALQKAHDADVKDFEEMIAKLKKCNISKSKSFVEIPLGNWILFEQELKQSLKKGDEK